MIAYTVLQHFKALVKDLSESRNDGSWVIPIAQEPFRDAAFSAATEIEAALNGYFFDQDTAKLQQLLINAGMNFNQRWDTWAETMQFESSASKLLHGILLRFSKGAMRHWRLWIIDSGK